MINNTIKSDAFIDYVRLSRWFQNKNEKIIEIKIHDFGEFNDVVFLILNIKTESNNYLYYYPMVFAENEYKDAVKYRSYADTIIELFKKNSIIKCNNGIIKFVKTGNFKIDSNRFSLIKSEQSNSSFIINNIIVKNYRYLQYGQNPDITMINHLIKNGFYNVPEPFGYALYESKDVIYIMNATRYIENSSDLWSYSLNKINSMIKNGNYNDIKDYIINMSRDLGILTGKMHIALYKSYDPEFIPEKSSLNDINNIINETLKNFKDSNVLNDGIILFFKNKFESIIKNGNINIPKFRIHGDYHLGQILISDKLYVIDFEGEPMRDISERSKKSIPLRDAAGMMRSLSYLINSFPGYFDTSIEKASNDEFLNYYKQNVKDIIDFNDDVMCIFLMQKALYELLYEIRNRPAWVNIPLNYIKNVYLNLRS